jgi:putative ABC transport system ATP-binding protein
MSMPSDNPLLHATDLVFSYGRDPALRGLSINIGAAESVAITGPSGSGKSTLLHLLCGLLVPSSGEVWVNDTALHTLDEARRAALRRAVFGVVYQFNQLLPELTVAENTALPLLFAGVRPAVARQRAQHWLDRLEVSDCADRRPGALSGGQLQRAAIARAMAGEPKVLLADEPTGALDTTEADSVLRILRSAVVSHGVTLVIVTHDPHVVAYTDRTVRMVDGTLAGDADRDALEVSRA